MHKRLSNTHFGFGSVMSLELPVPQFEGEIADEILPVRDLPPAEPKQRIRDMVVSRLTSARADTDKLRQIRGVLLGEAIEGEVSLSAVDEFLEVCEIQGRLAVAKKHKEIREKGRAQLELVEQLAIKFGEANATWNGLAVERDRANSS